LLSAILGILITIPVSLANIIQYDTVRQILRAVKTWQAGSQLRPPHETKQKIREKNELKARELQTARCRMMTGRKPPLTRYHKLYSNISSYTQEHLNLQ